jgi:hypothetical protein
MSRAKSEALSSWTCGEVLGGSKLTSRFQFRGRRESRYSTLRACTTTVTPSGQQRLCLSVTTDLAWVALQEVTPPDKVGNACGAQYNTRVVESLAKQIFGIVDFVIQFP